MSDGSRKPRRRRTWPQRLLLTCNVLVVLVCFTAAGGLLYVFRQATNVARFSLSTTLNETTRKGEPENFLLVGVDSAAGINVNDPINIGRSASQNTDTIMILRVDPGSDKAQLLSLPRDLWVRIAETDYHEKINAALATGGPQRLIETIQQNFGIPINHFVQVDFEAFRSLVDAVGGIPIYFPWPARDTHTGLNITKPGCVILDGVQGLAYARSRYFETEQNGVWSYDPTSDLGRIARQQQFIKLALKRAIAKGARNPFVVTRLIGTAEKDVTLDDQLTTGDLVSLAEQFHNFDPNSLEVYTPPTTGAVIGGADVLLLNTVAAQPIFDRFRDLSDSRNPNRAVAVSVTNGSGVASQAETALAELAKLGFVTVGSGDATSFQNAHTSIHYAPGGAAAAVRLARYLPFVPELVEDDDLAGSSVTLYTGLDFTGFLNTPRPMSIYAGFLATTTTSAPTVGAGAGTTSTSEASMVPSTPPGQLCG
ncbi:MAG TPA: LCP family protein [Acidimicrobiales bacterium]|nr:LCP family protein [Acidimicrobiales bacterium]